MLHNSVSTIPCRKSGFCEYFFKVFFNYFLNYSVMRTLSVSYAEIFFSLNGPKKPSFR